MFKTSSIPFLGPRVSSKIKNTTRQNAPIAWSASRSTAKPSFKSAAKLNGHVVPMLSAGFLVAIVGMMALHLFWVNTYSSKGFELDRVQAGIEEQTEVQKKLLVKQSLMSSTVSLSDLSGTGLVPVTDSETLTGATVAQAK